jgi:uncharacterized protein (TIGR01777 family)
LLVRFAELVRGYNLFMPSFLKESAFTIPAEELYRYHTSPGAFSRLCPPWEALRLEGPDTAITPGEERTVRLGPKRVSLPWVARHEDFVEGRQFVDVMVLGPFRSWRHTHRFEPQDDGGCRLIDEIEYELPMQLPLQPLVASRLQRIFTYRHRQIARDLERIAAYPGPASSQPGPRLKVGITGGSGLVGSALTSFLGVAGHEAFPLVRGSRPPRRGALWWPEPDLSALEGMDAVVHLAGENIAQLWTRAVKEELYYSRVEGTRRLCRALARLKNPPKTLICASAVGYYDFDQPGPVGEWGAPGRDLLAEICRDWEAATQEAEEAGIRVCHLRVGLVVSSGGGIFGIQFPVFGLGLGAVLGSGEQMQSFIDRDDLVAAIYHLLNRPDLCGPFNGTAPYPISQRVTAQALAAAVRRPLILRVPERPVRLLLGDQADLFFKGLAVLPERLIESGFTFQAPTLWDSLVHQLALRQTAEN